MPKLTVKCSVEELESWKVAAHGELLTLSGWVRSVLTERGQRHDAEGAVAADAPGRGGAAVPETRAAIVSPRSVSADPVRQAEDWLKARAGRPAKPHPKPGGKR